MHRSLIVIAHNLRSSHNVGSLLRTADGLGVEMVYLTGYTPYPSQAKDGRLPHISAKLNRQIHKTALGAEGTQKWQAVSQLEPLLAQLKQAGYTIAALEQTDQAQSLPDYTPPDKLALILGREVAGIEPEIIAHTDLQLVIPMFGQKESFNVVQAAAMALFYCRFCA
jgi:tRNA G18 (ribose-2'-O)-methylase SpoU